MKIEIGQNIKFKLDNNWEGEGVVRAVYSHSVEVELSKPCKEFDSGVMILVGRDEIS